jgi:putative membrane-bound dehydrogenase-like protein
LNRQQNENALAMKRFFYFSLALAALAGAELAAGAAQFKLGAHNFTLPDGFSIEVAAPSSLVPRPIEADFDEQGRLYVTDSSGSNDKVVKQLVDKPHRVLRLEDTDGDGTFDKSVVFADKMMFPEGCLWYDGSLFVSAPPSIWKLTDTNADGVADVRVEWFQGKSLGGCANDLHGPYLGPDGWIYWSKGGFERQTNILGNGKTFISRASHIYRARPDGTGLEPIMTGGMDNPVGLAWSAEGELFLSGTFFQNPSGGKRDGIIHVIYGGVYGKENDALEGHPRTGDLMPIMTHLGPAAPCGLARYESSVFGTDYQGNLFVCNFNLHKISRHVLKASGSTFTTTDSDFLVSDNTDFHPTDVFEDADGSLLIIDTGGWYKLCCPTSQLHKPDVLGAIYRVRRKDARLVNNPLGRADLDGDSPKELVQYLDDARPFVVKRATAALARHGTNAVPALEDCLKKNDVRDWEKFETLRRNAVWALTRIDSPESRLAAANVLNGMGGDSLRLAVLNSAALRRSVSAGPAARYAVRWPRPIVRRAALMALGRIRAPVSPEFASAKDDRALEHALIDALIRRGETKPLEEALSSTNVHARRAALIALDQMPGGDLKSEQVTPLLASTNVLLKQTANWIISHHPEWAAALAGFLKERTAVPNLSDSERAELQQQLTQFVREPAVQSLVASTARDTAAPKPNRLTALRTMAAANFKNPKDIPEQWADALVPCVNKGGDIDLQRQSVLAARALPRHSAELRSALDALASNQSVPPDIRLNALSAIRGLPELGGPGFAFVSSQLAETNPVALRGLAANLLATVPLADASLRELTGFVNTAGPLEAPKLLAAFSRGTNETTGLLLVDSLRAARSIHSLRAEQVRPNLTNFPATVRAKAEELLASLNTDAAKEKARLDELLPQLKDGDVRRGQAIFNGQKAACASCHAIGYLGGNIGPDLTRIGQIRNERDLLEAIVYPSASFVRSYEPVIVTTKSGDEQSGVLRRDAPDEVVLGTGPGVEARIARADITEMRPGSVSVMPAGLDEQLTRQELADLLAFLKSTKW